MLAFLEPVIAKDVAIEIRRLFVALDAFAIVNLREELDVAREREHGPGRFAQHAACDLGGIRDLGVAAQHFGADRALDAAEQLLVFELFVAEAHESFEHDLIAESLFGRELENLRADIAFHETEDARVGTGLEPDS